MADISFFVLSYSLKMMSVGVFMHKIIENIGIPKDVTMGLPVLHMVGSIELCIGNYRGILEYEDSLIRIQTKAGQIHVIGSRLKIEYYTNEEMKICGSIQTISFC